MTAPVQITFRDMPSSSAITAHVEKRAAKLDHLFDRIVACHVVLEEPNQRHQKGQKFHVRIDMTVPGKALIVDRNPADLKTDLLAAIDDAFGDAERILDDYAQHLRHDRNEGKAHVRPPHGVIGKIFHDRGYGFIEAEGDGHEVYFHKNAVLDAKFENVAVGAKVRFAEEDGDKGPQASTVHVVTH